MSVRFPAQTTFWCAFDSVSVLHVGHTNPDQVTDSGQESFVTYTTRQDLLDDISVRSMQDRLPELPTVGQEVNSGYHRNGRTTVYVKQSHTRTDDEIKSDDTYEVSR